ncbi:glycoside hydrolase [Akkermansiaceae bacterium]|nr:glycoside hydrolase [Akkermansiaceae bacterium]MDA7888488.1 glycoside hydrolase [Akkermansiaceae bacterium]
MMFPRRHFLKNATALGFAGSLGMRFRLGAAPTSTVLEIKTISHLPNRYHGWPTLTRRANGQLLVVCSGGREQHVCPFGRVEMQRSDDDGASWSFPRTLYDGPIDDRDAGVVETAKGSLLVTTFTSLAYASHLPKDDRRASWLAAHHRIPEKERNNELGEWMIRSTDGGITWSERSPSIVNSPHGPTQLSDGRLLHAGKKLWSEGKEVGVCESRDDGKSWQWLAAIHTREGDHHKDYHELHAVEAGDGTIIVQIRNHNKANFREILQCESKDGGQTWTTPHAIGVWGLPSFLTRLRDGRLLMTYGYRRKPFGNQARLSEDHGQTWSEPVIISDDGVSGDLGYPSTVELGDGSLLTVWYEKLAKSQFAVLRQARWQLS